MGVVILTDRLTEDEPLLVKWIGATDEAGFRTLVVARSTTPGDVAQPSASGLSVLQVPRGAVVSDLARTPGFNPTAPLAFRSSQAMREAAERRGARAERRMAASRAAQPQAAEPAAGHTSTSTAEAMGSRARRKVQGLVDRLDDDLIGLRSRHFHRARASRLDAQGLGYLTALSRARGSRARLWQSDPRIRESIADYRGIIAGLNPDLIVATTLDTLAAATIVSQDLPHHPPVIYICRSLESTDIRRSEALRRLRRSAEDYFIPTCQRVVATSDPVAQTLKSEFGLAQTPDVVLDAPDAASTTTGVESLRRSITMGEDQPLLVHTGLLGASSRLNPTLRAIQALPDAHLAIVVARPSDPALQDALAVAQRLGVRGRVHPSFAASPAETLALIDGADVGIIAASAPTDGDDPSALRLMEFVAAGVPVVASEATGAATTVLEKSLGLGYPAGDDEALAAAIEQVLAQPSAYMASDAVKAAMSWDTQAHNIVQLYREILVSPAAAASADTALAPVAEAASDRALSTAIAAPAASLNDSGSLQPRLAPVKSMDHPVRLFVGPANMAGQGWAWAQAVEAADPSATTTVVTMNRTDDNHVFPSDVYIGAQDRHTSQVPAHVEQIAADYTHALLESATSPFGETTNVDSVVRAYRRLTSAGVTVALAFHGSEVRDPQAHLDRFEDSFFLQYTKDELDVLKARVARSRLIAEMLRLPTFVSTPDLLAEIPDAQLLPLVVDVPHLESVGSTRTILSDSLPVVLHAPSSARVAGSTYTDEVLQDLAREGRITYRRLEWVPPEEFPQALASADIIVDKLQLGYGVTATQAMAAGRVVVGWAGPVTREHVPDLPLVDAYRSNLRDVVLALVKDHGRIRELGQAGQSFARERHDGRASALALAGFLGTPDARAADPRLIG